MPNRWLSFAFSGTLALFAAARPAQACVACSTEGECLAQPAGLSGNCGCLIKQRNGRVTCKPVGVCDAADPRSCDDDEDSQPPWNRDAKALEIDTGFLHFVSSQDPDLGTALWGAVTEYSPSGERLRTTLTEGEHTGTFGLPNGGSSHAFRVIARKAGQTGFSFEVWLVNHRSGETSELRGHFSDRGTRGEIVRLRAGLETPYLTWDLRDQTRRAPGPK